MQRVFPNWGYDDILPSLKAVKDDFRRKFDRDMTPEEIHLYRLTKSMLETPDDLFERRVKQINVQKERRQQRAKVTDGAA